MKRNGAVGRAWDSDTEEHTPHAQQEREEQRLFGSNSTPGRTRPDSPPPARQRHIVSSVVLLLVGVGIGSLLGKGTAAGTAGAGAAGADAGAADVSAQPTCTKFFVLSTQRSGTEWFVDMLRQQPEVYTRGEELMGFSYEKNVTREQWESAVDSAFNRVCGEAGKMGKFIAGYKVMYDQVPKQEGKFVEGEFFGGFLRSHGIRVLHLVREATILHIASLFGLSMDTKILNITDYNENYHTSNKEAAAARREKSPKMPVTENTILNMKYLEREHETWLRFMMSTGAPYHFVSYEETMLDTYGTRGHMILQFLGVQNMSSHPPLQAATWQAQHKPSCEDRIENYERVEENISGTMSWRACKILAGARSGGQ